MEYRFKVSQAPDLEVRVPSGRIELVEGDSDSVTVTVDTKDPEFQVEQRGDLIIAASSRNGGGWTSKSARVVIETPRNACAEIATASANITSRVPLHKASIKTASGNVTLDVADTVAIKTASGNASLRGSTKSLRYSTASGDLEVSGSVSGSAAIVTVSGDVEIGNTDATVEVKTVSGNLNLQRFAGSSASFRTVSGDVEIGVPPGTKLHLEADTRSGRVSLPTDPPPVTETRREMTIRGRLISGNVTIRRAPE